MKIKTKINLSFLMAFVVINSFLAAFIGVYTTNLVKDKIHAYLQSSSRARAEHIRTFLQDQEKTAVILAEASVFRDFLKESATSAQYPIIKEKVNKRLLRTIKADPSIYEVFILSADGKILASSDPSQEGEDKSQDDYFVSAKNGTYVKDVYFSETIKKLSYSVSTPIKDDAGTLLGVSVLRYLPSVFFDIVKSENGLGDTEENFLINRDKFFISPSRFLGEEVILKQKVETQNANNCFDPQEEEYVKKNGYSGMVQKFGSQILEAKDYRNVDVMATHAYIPETGWCLITKADKVDLFAFRGILIIIFFLAFTIAAILFYLFGFAIAKKITSPIKNLQIKIDKIKKGQFDIQAGINSGDELGVLSENFNVMAMDLKKAKTELENYNAKLKQEVAEQTKNLEAVKAQLQVANLGLEQKVKARTVELQKLQADQEKIIQEKTRELQQKIEDLEKLNKFMTDRELKMVALKKELEDLKSKS